MKYILESEFDKMYDKLNEYIPADFTFANLDTKRYVEYLNSCIDANKSRYNPEVDGEIHIHHIWPKSIGGPDIKDNTIALTYKQHLDAHKILADDNLDQPKLLQAVGILSHGFSDLTEEERQRYHTALFRYLSRAHSSVGNPNYGKGHSQETRDKLSQKSSEGHNPIYVTFKDLLTDKKVTVAYRSRKEVAKDLVDFTEDDVKDRYKRAYDKPEDYEMRPVKRVDDSNIVAVAIRRDKEEAIAKDTTAIPIIGIEKNTGKKVPEDAEYFTSSNAAAKWIKEHGYTGLETTEDMKNDIRDAAVVSPEQVLKQGRIPERFGYYWLRYSNLKPEYLDWVIQYAKQDFEKPSIEKVKED